MYSHFRTQCVDPGLLIKKTLLFHLNIKTRASFRPISQTAGDQQGKEILENWLWMERASPYLRVVASKPGAVKLGRAPDPDDDTLPLVSSFTASQTWANCSNACLLWMRPMLDSPRHVNTAVNWQQFDSMEWRTFPPLSAPAVADVVERPG